MKIILAIFSLFLSTALYCQPDTNLLLHGKVSDDVVLLRWAPTNPAIWQAGNERGYVILRSKLDIDHEAYEVLDTVRPATLQKFQDKKDHIDPAMLNLGANALFSSYLEGDAISADQNLESRFTSALYAADMDALTAELLGLRYIDQDAQPGQKYQYVVIATGSEVPISSATVMIDMMAASIPAPILITEVVEDEGKVNLVWQTHPRFPEYTAYYIERSENGSDFKRLNSLPYTFTPDIDSLVPNGQIFYRDSVENYTTYHYRIQGIDLFGEAGPYSQIITAMGRDRTPPVQASDLTFAWEGDTFHLYWDFMGQEKITGFNIRSTDHLDNPPVLENDEVIDAGTRDYRGVLDSWYRGRLYFVCAIDTAGNESLSDPIMIFKHNTDAPARVAQIEGEIDSSGIMTLSWTANKEEDLWGYMIYMANDSLHEFSGIVGTPIRDTFFIDTLPMQTLSENVYYKVVASDFAGNLSPVSSIITVSRPDFIPPNAPNFNHYQVEERGVYLKWGPSLSPDVERHELRRRVKGDAGWDLIAEFKSLAIDYLDTLIAENVVYQYRISAVDDASLQANCPKDITVRTRRIKNDWQISALEINSRNDQPVIKWSYPVADQVRFIIYRSKDNGPYSTYMITSDNFFPITAAVKGNYSFKIRAQHGDGSKSKLSAAIQIES